MGVLRLSKGDSLTSVPYPLLSPSLVGGSEGGLQSKVCFEKLLRSCVISLGIPPSVPVGTGEGIQAGSELPVLLGPGQGKAGEVLTSPSRFLALVPESGIKKVMIPFYMWILQSAGVTFAPGNQRPTLFIPPQGPGPASSV